MSELLTSAEARINGAALGYQHYLRITAIPATAEPSLIGKCLIHAGALTVAGDYYCDFSLSGQSESYVHLTATIGAGTSTSDVYSTYKDGTTSYQGFTGDGAMTSTTLQTSSLTTLKGEQVGRAKITLATSPNVTFTKAEVNGKQ